MGKRCNAQISDQLTIVYSINKLKGKDENPWALFIVQTLWKRKKTIIWKTFFMSLVIWPEFSQLTNSMNTKLQKNNRKIKKIRISTQHCARHPCWTKDRHDSISSIKEKEIDKIEKLNQKPCIFSHNLIPQRTEYINSNP